MKVIFIGAGNMGGAVVRGLLGAGVSPSDVKIVERSDEVRRGFATLGVEALCVEKLSEAGITEDTVAVIATKPWQSGEVRGLLDGFTGIVCSLMAGITTTELKELYQTPRVVRVMPNTAVEWGEGVSFVVGSGEEVTKIEELFKMVGIATTIPEDKMDAHMIMGSCGLAYALRYARASMAGGTQLGIAPQQGQAVMAALLRGAATMLEKGEHPETMIDKITTPGGVTIRGLNAMEMEGFTAAVLSGYTVFDKK